MDESASARAGEGGSSESESERLAWERALLARIRAGESAAFGELFSAYARPLFSRVLLPRLGNHAAAEDALSETFRLAIERISQFEDSGTSIYFWLARIASNKATDMHRAKKVSGRALVNLEEQLSVLQEKPVTPDNALHYKTQYQGARERLERCLGALNPRYREAIELRFYHEVARPECASRMGVKLGTFDVLLLRSLKALRKAWDELQASEKEAISVRFG